jgi:hypothetical protein
MSTFYIGRMCGSHRQRHQVSDRHEVSDRDREAVMSALGRDWAAGRLDQDEYEARATQAAAALRPDDLRAALGDTEPIEPPRPWSGSWSGRSVPVPVLVAAVLVAAVAVTAVLGLAFHPAFFWVVPLVGFKLARFHGRAGWDRRRPAERTISV